MGEYVDRAGGYGWVVGRLVTRITIPMGTDLNDMKCFYKKAGIDKTRFEGPGVNVKIIDLK